VSVAELLTAARAAGLELVPDGDGLRVVGPRPLPADLLDELRAHKVKILVALARRHPDTSDRRTHGPNENPQYIPGSSFETSEMVAALADFRRDAGTAPARGQQ